MTIAIILGTRPEIIKFSPIIRRLEELGEEYFTIHTGQHYSFEMDRIFFNELELPEPDYHLDVGSGSHGVQTGKMLPGIEKILMQERPRYAMVQGDTNTVLAGSIAASKLGTKLGHVESGLRSFDRTMPEEINRVVSDHLSDFLFAPTEISKKQLFAEGIPEDKIYLTGNTVVDAVYQNLEISGKKYDISDITPPDDFILVTSHRQENVDDDRKLRSILSALGILANDHGLPVIFPAHPRTVKMMKRFQYAAPENVSIIKPTGYLEFLQLEQMAKLIITDSGGIQEEACILGIPCVTIRENTERPETLHVGSNVLAGTDPEQIVISAVGMMDCNKKWENPFGDGKSGIRIVDILLEHGKERPN